MQARGYIERVRQADTAVGRPRRLPGWRDPDGPMPGPPPMPPIDRGSPQPDGPGGDSRGPNGDDGGPTGDGGDERPVARDIRVLVDDWWNLHDWLSRSGNQVSAERLARLLDDADRQIGAISVLLAGANVVIIGTILGGTMTRLELTATGVARPDIELSTKISGPLLQEFAETAREIDRFARESGGGIERWSRALSQFDAAERRAYRELVHRPASHLSQAELERIQSLSRRVTRPAPLEPGSAAHKARRWADYKARSGQWKFERWSPNYELNMRRASRAHAAADELHAAQGWGQREVRVKTKFHEVRVLDIADPVASRGVEVKSGYVTHTSTIADQVRRDTALVKLSDWQLHWHVEGRFSEPLRQVLRRARITFSETHPTTPIKDVMNLRK
jgi:hypothetical protein